MKKIQKPNLQKQKFYQLNNKQMHIIRGGVANDTAERTISVPVDIVIEPTNQ